jgi:membrane protein YdbS with pleckstrin-like domain
MTAAPVPPPAQRLAPNARWLWRLSAGLRWGAALVVGALVARTLDGALAVALVVVPLVGFVADAIVAPELRWRRWRYEVRPQEVDVQRGAFTVTRTLVPMLRVQHVDTTRGLLDQLLGLATVVFHTAAGANRIPALDVAEAARVRDRIAELAREADVV